MYDYATQGKQNQIISQITSLASDVDTLNTNVVTYLDTINLAITITNYLLVLLFLYGVVRACLGVRK